MTAARLTSLRRPFALVVALLLAMLWLPALISATPAHAATTVTVTPSNENCNGILPTPGSENTEKKLVGGDLEPGGTAIFQITYPVSVSDFGQTFTVTDCPVLGGDVHSAQAYQFSFVPNNVAFTVQFTLVIPASTPIGTSYCNYAKTTASPSASPSSNRKAGPACFTVGGNLRIEKHATGNTTDLLAGAQFSVTCPTAAPTTPLTASPVEITGLTSGGSAVTATYVTADGAYEASGTADPGFIGIAGPSGTDCAVTETAAPSGYLLPATTTQHYTIPVGTSQQVVNWFNEPATPNVHLAKSADPASGSTVRPGSTINYTLSYYNDGTLDATNATITDPVPANTTYVAGSASDGGTFDGATNTVTWTGVNVADGTSGASPAGTRTFSVTVDADTPSGTEIDNTGHIKVGQDAPIDSNTTQHFVGFPVLAIAKSADPASGSSVLPGSGISYTLSYYNSGNLDALGATITDTLPPHTTFVSAANGGSYDSASNTVTWAGIDVAAGTSAGSPAGSVSFSVTVNADAPNGAELDNTGHIQAPGGTPVDSNTTQHFVKFPVLSINKSADPASGSIVQRGATINYTVTVSNSGLAAAAAQTVTDTLPANVTVVEGSISPAPVSSDASHIVWSVDVPAATGDGPGTSVLTYSVTVNADAPLGSTQTNVATLGDQTSTTDHHVPTGALTLVKHVDKTSAAYAATLTYKFDAASTGDLDQTNVVVTDVLPAKTTYVAGSAKCTDGGTCTAAYNAATNTVTWALGDLAAGSAARHMSYQVTIDTPSFDPTAGLPVETILNTGVVASNETPTTTSNQVKTTVTAVLGVKVVRPPKLPFTGSSLPISTSLIAGLSMLGAGIVLTSVRRRRRS